MPRRSIQPKYLDFDLASYAGRYIALVEGRIVAVGETYKEAHTRARLARPQRPATILRIANPETGQEPDSKQ